MLLKAAALDANDVDTWYKLGQCYVLEGRYARARKALEEALRLLPGDAEIREKIESLRTIERAAEAERTQSEPPSP